MYKIGINCISLEKDWPEKDFTPYIKKASKLGFEAIELFTAYLVNHPKDKLDEYRKVADDLGIQLQFSTGLGMEHDLSSQDETVRKNGMEHVKKTLEIINYLKGDLYGGLTYAAWSARIQNIEEKYVRREISLKSVRELSKVAEDYGITYCLEVVNRFEQFMLNTAAEAVEYIKELDRPNVKINLDTYHMSIEEDDVIDAIYVAGDKLGHMHLGESNRRVPGSGRFPWNELIKALKEVNYKGTLNFEPFVLFGGGVADGISLWRDLTYGASQEEAEENMKKSIEFIKNRVYML